MKRLLHLLISAVLLSVISIYALAQEDKRDPLVRLLETKGIITAEEAARISNASSPELASRRLSELLLAKGLITQREYDDTILALGASSTPHAVTASAKVVPPPAETIAATIPSKSTGPTQTPPGGGEVSTTGKIPLKIYGNILFNANFVDRGANTIDIPLFPQKHTVSADQNHQNFNATLRQSRFGLRYEGTIFDDAKLIGVFEFDLLGGKPAFANGANFDIFRLRLAYGRIDWKKNSVEAGQDWAVFSPLNPTSLASYAIPAFSTSGNLWNRMPQIRYEHREGDKSKLIFTAALLDPDAGDSAGNPAARVIGLGERGSLPAFEARLGFTAPTHGKETSAGISGHYSRLLGAPGNPAGTTVLSPIDSYGVSGDANIWLTSGLRLTGEAFHGRALGIFSGDIAQSALVIAGRARGINSTGGWGEIHVEAPTGYQGSLKNISANAGYGIEDNRDQDLTPGARQRNRTYMLNGQYKFSPNFTMALEYRRVLTDWFQEPLSRSRLNWAGLSFMYSF